MELKDTVLTPKQMRGAELAAEAHGTSLAALMDNAGTALGRRILEIAVGSRKKNILIICGSGNNGGDGYVAADFLLGAGAEVRIGAIEPPRTELAKVAARRTEGRCSTAGLDELLSEERLAGDIIVDCVFGTGFRGELEDKLRELFLKCSGSGAVLIACDCPSGINCLNGQAAEGAFRARETVTFHSAKLGMLLSPAKELCGRVITADIGIGEYFEEYADTKIRTVSREMAASLLPARPENSHKGTFGRVVLVCGSGRYPGAAIISAEAALRSGVGIVQLCTTAPVVASAVSRLPECTYTALPADDEGYIDASGADKILAAIKGAATAVIGCGLGRTEGTAALVYELIRKAECPLIIDADGINCLSAHIDILKEKQTEVVLTPHPAELARLCHTDTVTLLKDPYGYALELSGKYGVTVHAKSAQTLTVSEDSCYITDFGCSALAKGGSGDMLAGLIGGLAAQGLSAVNSCLTADFIMGESAKGLCREMSARGVLARDIIARFPRTFFELENWPSSE